jgi:hypothetical protein
MRSTASMQVVAAAIPRRHGREIVVVSARAPAQSGAARTARAPARCQRARDELEAVVEPRRGAVHRADERPFPAATRPRRNRPRGSALARPSIAMVSVPGRASAPVRGLVGPAAAKSSNARFGHLDDVVVAMNGAPSRAHPGRPLLMQHSHSSTAHAS